MKKEKDLRKAERRWEAFLIIMAGLQVAINAVLVGVFAISYCL